jgi:hypothetical protein
LDQTEVRLLIPRAYVGDESYAEVNSAWLPAYYSRFRTELSRLGIMRGTERFDCNRFAEMNTGMAQIMFFREVFHSGIAAQALAVGPFWYWPEGSQSIHAIVQIVTERGVIFLDPQTGVILELTPAEIASAFLQVI